MLKDWRILPHGTYNPISVEAGEVVRREYWGDSGFTMEQYAFNGAMLSHSLWLDTGDWLFLEGMYYRYQEVVTHKWTIEGGLNE